MRVVIIRGLKSLFGSLLYRACSIVGNNDEDKTEEEEEEEEEEEKAAKAPVSNVGVL